MQLPDGTLLSSARAFDPNASGNDQAPIIQAELAAAAGRTVAEGRVVRLAPNPSGTVVIGRPLVVSGEGAGLVGAAHRTRLYQTYYGPAVCCRRLAAMPEFVAGPFTGSRAMLLGRGPWLDLSLYCPPLDVSGCTGFTAEAWANRNADAGETLAVLQSSLNLGPFYSKVSWGFYETSGSRLRLYWNANGPAGGTGVSDSASGVLATQAWQHQAMSFDGTTLRGFINGVKVIEAVVDTHTVPQWPGRAEVTALGANPADPTGMTWAAGAPNAAVHGVRVSNVCRYMADFTPPDRAFGNDASTLLLLNFDLRTDDPDFVVGLAGGGLAYFPPQGAPEFQQGDNVVANLTGKGFYVHDSITGRFEHLESTESGFQFLGSCYENDCRDFRGLSQGYGIILGSQCEGTSISGIKLRHQAVGLLVSGSVGGNYSGILTPEDKALAGVAVLYTSDVNFNHLQIDEEGQATEIQAAVVAHGGTVPTSVKFFGGLIGTQRPVPVVDLSGGASVQLYGTSYFTNPAAAEAIKFRDPPRNQAIASGLTCYSGPNVPLTLSPAYFVGG